MSKMSHRGFEPITFGRDALTTSLPKFLIARESFRQCCLQKRLVRMISKSVIREYGIATRQPARWWSVFLFKRLAFGLMRVSKR